MLMQQKCVETKEILVCRWVDLSQEGFFVCTNPLKDSIIFDGMKCSGWQQQRRKNPYYVSTD